MAQIYRFEVGETVLFTERRDDVSWKAEYTIVAQMEPDDLGQRYQIMSTNRAHTRMAHEHELSARD